MQGESGLDAVGRPDIGPRFVFIHSSPAINGAQSASASQAKHRAVLARCFRQTAPPIYEDPTAVAMPASPDAVAPGIRKLLARRSADTMFYSNAAAPPGSILGRPVA